MTERDDTHRPVSPPTAQDLRKAHVRGARFGVWGSFSRWVVSTPWVVYTLVAVDLAAAIAGYIYWYGSDILASPLYLWPFVPDSPLSGTLVAIALLALHRGRHWEFLGLMAATGAIKYGLWTDWYWFTNVLSGGHYTFEAVHLSASHFAMVIQGLLLLPFLRPRLRHVLFVAAWYGLNDLTDYAFGSHPRIPNPQDLGLIAGFAVVSTIALCSAWLVWALVRRRSAAV